MVTIWKENGKNYRSGMERSESLWIQEEYRNGSKEDQTNGLSTHSNPLQEDINTEVAVIGGGLAGILTAFELQERGLKVIVLEAREVGSGVTKNTTAKITSQHGLIYRKLLMYKGEEKARQYARANQNALERYEEIIDRYGIKCDFEHQPNYIYTLDNELRIQQEVEAAKRLGLPASFTRETALPFQIKAAVRFEQQSQFHPMSFLDQIAKNLTIYQNTRVTEIGDDGVILTERGRVKARKIVIATHYPFINRPGYFFIRLHQSRSYLTALEGCFSNNLSKLDGMYLDADKQGYTFRAYQNYLILGGGGHRSGKCNPVDAYGKIEQAARKWYPNARIKYTWSAQDCITPDSVPYIGTYSTKTPNMYVATGFNKWGMTSSMVSAMIISDMITGKENQNQKVFNPRRMLLSGSRKLLKDAAIVTVSLLSEQLKIPKDKLSDIERGKAGIIRHNGLKVGVYRDNKDKYYFVTTKCPHLGCGLEWNQNELTWDCPCHGSRFDYKGYLINNPALRDTFDSCQRKRKNLD